MKLYTIGGGKMAGAIIKGLLKEKTYEAEDIVIIDPFVDEKMLSESGLPISSLSLYKSAEGLEISGEDIVLLAVKPQIMGEVLSSLPICVRDALIISIAAGISTSFISDSLVGADSGLRIIRVMPNTPAAIGLGVSIFYCNDFCFSSDRVLVSNLFSAVGLVDEVMDEDLLHVVTSVSGSGPAYVFSFMESFVGSAVAHGLSEDLAWRWVFGVMRGSLGLVSGLEFGLVSELRRNVTSEGGTTEAALAEMEDLSDILKRGIGAGIKRSRELG